MAYYDVETQVEEDKAHLVMTVLMTGIVAIATWELWGRHIAPYFYGHELSPATIVKALFGIKGTIAAEIVYLLAAVPFVPLSYLFVWRPLMSATVFAKHWALTGTSYGLALFVLAEALKTFIMTMPAHENLFAPAASGWLLGAVALGIMMAGFVQLREMGRQIILRR